MFRKAILIFLIIFTLFSFTACGTDAREANGDIDRTAAPEVKEINGIPLNAATAVVTEAVADVFAQPDVTSQRVSQVLYNQPVSILEERGGWVRLRAVNGSSGWVRSKFVEKDISSIYGKSRTHKIIVTSKEKGIFSDSTGGITIKDVAMGTEFFTFNTAANAYEVYLPGNKTGWFRGSGIIHVDLNSEVPVTSGDDFASSALKFKGTSYLINGLSSLGIDSPGLIYLCSRINGVNLPRNLEGQMSSGDEISMDEVAAGDIVFLASADDEKVISDAGICLGNGQFIHASRSSGYVRLDGLNESGSDGKPVLARRIFR